MQLLGVLESMGRSLSVEQIDGALAVCAASGAVAEVRLPGRGCCPAVDSVGVRAAIIVPNALPQGCKELASSTRPADLSTPCAPACRRSRCLPSWPFMSCSPPPPAMPLWQRRSVLRGSGPTLCWTMKCCFTAGECVLFAVAVSRFMLKGTADAVLD